METLEDLGRHIETTEDLRSIVRTMKTLSAVNIRQYELAGLALHEYSVTIEQGLQILLRSAPPPPAFTQEKLEGTTFAVVFGSDHGLCGRFNFQIAQYARAELRRRGVRPETCLYFVAGARAASQLEGFGERVGRCFLLPGTVTGLTGMAHDIFLEIDGRRAERTPARILLFYNRHLEQSTASPHCVQLLPLATPWLRRLLKRHWPSRTLPTFSMDMESLFSALISQHLFIGLFRAGAESAASEHATRLAAMQTAEHNIKENLNDLNVAYRQRRQEAITAEILDIVAGYEVLEPVDERVQ